MNTTPRAFSCLHSRTLHLMTLAGHSADGSAIEAFRAGKDCTLVSLILYADGQSRHEESVLQ